MAFAAAVADRFRTLSGNTLTPLQLIKLTYIAHGWSYPLRGEGLINDPIEAWQYGPVVPSLYHALKDYKASPVSRPVWPAPALTPAEDEHVRNVHAVYGSFSGGQLSTMTHRPDTPWDRAWRRGRNSLIDNGEIEAHYRRLHAERNQPVH